MTQKFGPSSESPPRGTTIVVLQPGYLPWLGFFDQLHRADVFVYYDDVQYDKNGWRNRNRIKTQSGPLWLTVPVLHSGTGFAKILDVEIDRRTPWARKHLASVRQAYARAPFVDRYLPELETLLQREWTHLVDLDLACVDLMARWLHLQPRIERSSRLGINGDRSERLVNICRHFGATTYVSGDAAQTYLDVELFARHGIAVEWQRYTHPVYPQQHGAFVPYLSALDLLLNCGDEAPLIAFPGIR
ncbi:MAG: WbqC family protein [Acidobacteria bacterium]|nr:WbqC family protein [Acidobacteriota bacterium]